MMKRISDIFVFVVCFVGVSIISSLVMGSICFEFDFSLLISLGVYFGLPTGVFLYFFEVSYLETDSGYGYVTPVYIFFFIKLFK